eukprot:TRINITY_DN3180_c0_g1_i1.p1 TRINITY_DN3180_c0_g1~~TRINITY_DN3180_c0_g1_i1.p1  ORF type:complete len:177 (+),score=47.83 TRINITY_DN3180_c0_g1_i1:270-800(+)
MIPKRSCEETLREASHRFFLEYYPPHKLTSFDFALSLQYKAPRVIIPHLLNENSPVKRTKSRKKTSSEPSEDLKPALLRASDGGWDKLTPITALETMRRRMFEKYLDSNELGKEIHSSEVENYTSAIEQLPHLHFQDQTAEISHYFEYLTKHTTEPNEKSFRKELTFYEDYLENLY